MSTKAEPKRNGVRLRWKKYPKETGMRAIGAGPRGSMLHDGVDEYAWVNPLGGDWAGEVKGWRWTSDVFGGQAYTYMAPAPDEKTAKAQAMAYVKAALARRA